MRRGAQTEAFHNTLIYPRKDLLWMIPSVLGWALIYALPFFSSLMASFLSSTAKPHFVWLSQYQKLFRDPYYILSLKNTVFFLCPVLIAAIVLGIVLAQILFISKSMRWTLILILLPAALPSPAIAAVWDILFGGGSALVKTIRPKEEQWKYLTLFSLFLWKNAGVLSAMYLTGMQGLNPAMLDSARVDGAGNRTLFFCIELPLLKNVSVFALLYLLMNGVRIFRESYLLFGAYSPPNLYFVQHDMNLYFARLDYGRLSAAGSVFSSLLLCLFMILWKCLEHGEEEVS